MRVRITHPRITRGQILSQGVLALVLYFLFGFLDHPFHPSFRRVLLASVVVHLLLFAAFRRLAALVPSMFALVSIVDMVLLGVAVHFSGGVLSPFVFVFLSIIMAEATYGIEYPTASFAAAAVYLAVIGAEFTGIWPPYAIRPADVYASPFASLMIVSVTALYMLNSGQTYKVIMNSLKEKLEREQEAKQSMLRQLAKLDAPSQMGLVVNKIVHDLRGPLGAISGFVEMMQKDEKLDSETRIDCGLMLGELARITGLVNRMLAYARPGAAQRESLCPVDLLRTVLSVLSFYPGAKQVRFETRFLEPGAVRVRATKDELQQVYFNLLKNSVEAVAPSSSRLVQIDMASQGTSVEISISDTGPGFPPALLTKLSSDVVSTKSDGAGVGLIIVREILEAYGGHLQLQTGPDGGALVVTRLPCETATSSAG